MTPLEELQAAHKRLSELRDESAAGEWSSDLFIETFDLVDADLIVTLQHTIDAQLELLEYGIRFVQEVRGGSSYQGPAFTLARAINGAER